MNARSQAVARQNENIDANVAKIEAAKPRPSALAAMAARLNISEGKLQQTLVSTVFRKCSEDEFAALIIVANEYKLNPLLKEIYAFPAKGGGIVPLVSVDGWLRIVNEHPQFDGIEFDDILDAQGKVMAIEATIFRKDRARPIKVIEYLDECKQNTDPWKNMPNRMLRHKATIQAARYAFGFSGIYSDNDAEIQLVGEPVEARNVTPAPTREQFIAHDPATGEIIDNAAPSTATDDGDAPYAETVKTLLDRIAAAQTVVDAKAVQREWLAHADALPDHVNADIEKALDARLGELKGAA